MKDKMKEKSAEAIVEERLITGILNGQYPAFSKLKPERELANEFGFSRPVVHKAIIRLEAKGLVTIKARQGTEVNDYRESGKLALLESIYDLYHGGISIALNQSMLHFIKNNLEAMILLLLTGPNENRKACIQKQDEIQFQEGEDIFIWLQTFAFFCGNSIYPMLLNEFKCGILNVSHAVLKYGDHQQFKSKLKAVSLLLLCENPLDREAITQTILNLFEFIEDNWLIEGENHEDQFKQESETHSK